MSTGCLEGRVALVTGAAKGIGRALATTLAQSGVAVVGFDIADLSVTESTVAETGGRFLPIVGDVTDPDALRAATANAVDRYGKLEIVVANAGAYPSAPFDQVEAQAWRRLMELNLDGVFHTVQAALPYLTSVGWGRIVVISSSTVWMGVSTLVPYVTTKAGLIGFVRALAVEVGEHGITVNAITPGLVETETVLASWVGEQFDWVVSSQVVKRRMQPSDLASTLLYLCSPESSMITGQTINVDGGLAKH